jgi:hypothetical protein
MKPPLCSYELHCSEWRSAWGVLHQEAVALIRPCRCLSHDYTDFEEQLGRLHPGLHLGFDLRKERWVIYKWDREMVMDIVFTCEKAFEYRGKGGGWRTKTYPVRFGDWVLIQVAKSATDRFTRGSGWVERVMLDIEKKKEEAQSKRVTANAEAWVNDCMSSADRGSPFFRRRQFRQRKVRPNHPVKVPA